MRHCAIVLAAGKGSRMQSDVPKQYMELCGKPLLSYSLYAFEESFVDEVILVTAKEDISYCQKEIVDACGLKKVTKIIAGGKERYSSVYQGLLAAEGADYVYIHDGARPFLSQQILESARDCVEKYQACAAGMPVKDTIKIVNEDTFVAQTPARQFVWQVQTPQVFSYAIVRKAYDRLQKEESLQVTDDAMVVEQMLGMPVKLFEASYDNLKITTPEDLLIAEKLMEKTSREKTE